MDLSAVVNTLQFAIVIQNLIDADRFILERTRIVVNNVAVVKAYQRFSGFVCDGEVVLFNVVLPISLKRFPLVGVFFCLILARALSC